MKKRVVTAFMLIIVTVVLATAFTACDNDELLGSTWQLAVIYNEYGEIVACGEGYSYAEDIERVSVTCSLSRTAKIELVYNDGEKSLTGKMKQVSTGADGNLMYHVDYSNDTSGSVNYMARYDKNTSYDTTIDENDVERRYALEVTVTKYGDEYKLCFERTSSIDEPTFPLL